MKIAQLLGGISNDDQTITDYKTRNDNVRRMKSFEETIKSMKDAKSVIVETEIERAQFDADVERHRQRMDDRKENAQRKIMTMRAHIDDILDEVAPGSYVVWNDVQSPDQLDDVVFDPPPVPTEET